MSKAGKIGWQLYRLDDPQTWPERGRYVIFMTKKSGEGIRFHRGMYKRPGVFIGSQWYVCGPRDEYVTQKFYKINPKHYGNIVWAYEEPPEFWQEEK